MENLDENDKEHKETPKQTKKTSLILESDQRNSSQYRTRFWARSLQGNFI